MSDHAREPDPIAFRVLDANFNRAREALRTLEDCARFVLDDAGLAATLKEMRHALAAAVPAEWAYRLLAHRDIAGDAGRENTTPSEFARSTIAEVVAAAGKRLSESLRVLEEFGKTVDRGFAEQIEALRYRGYDVERRLLLAGVAKTKLASLRLYVLITESICRGDWFAAAEGALTGGADAIQLREKALTDRELLNRSRRLAELCRAHGKLLFVNDRPDIAAAAGAHGVHLGVQDLPVAAARRVLPADALIGVSTHTIAQVRGAAAEAPDYIAVGPMFPSTTKPQEHIAGPATLREARALTSLPLVAIGGITTENAAEVLQAASDCCLCTCHAVIAESDVAGAAGRLRTLIDAR